MAPRILRDLAVCHGDGSYSIDASDAGLAPGEWPARLLTDIDGGADLVRGREFDLAGIDFGGYNYHSRNIRVRVFND